MSKNGQRMVKEWAKNERNEIKNGAKNGQRMKGME